MQEFAYAPKSEPHEPAVRAAAELLLDSNPRIHRACEEQLVAWGVAAREALLEIAECEDAMARARVRRTLRRIGIRAWSDDFADFASRDVDLEEGMLLIARLPRPLLTVDKLGEIFDEWAEMLLPRVENRGPRKVVEAIGEFFYEDLGFRGDRRTYYDPDNSFIDQVVRRRKGIPISLSALYLIVLRRIGLPVEGVGLPGHFILRLRAARSVLIDPFHGGRVLTRKDCIERLQAMGYGFSERLLAPVDDRRMLLRALGNLLHTFGFGEDPLFVDAVQAARRQLVGSVG